MAKSSRHKRAITHETVQAAIRRFHRRGGIVKHMPDDFREQVEIQRMAARLERAVTDYQGLLE